ncbi:MAG: hypothetical protein ACXWT1_05455 [Methylobacter sp.]
MAKIKTVAYIGWRGNIEFEPIELDNYFTGLVGVSGAGKSTLGLALAYSLLPDRTCLNIRPITELNDPSQSSVDQLGSRVDDLYGYAYVILDIESRDKSRLIAGINVRPTDNMSQISKWAIRGVPDDYSLQELFRVIEGDEQSYPDIAILKQEVSTKGFDFHQYQTIGDYCRVLHEAGILPTPMEQKDDRILYGKLLETAFHGGISVEVSKRLKSYVMPEATRIPKSVSELRECVDQALQTKRSLNDATLQLETLKGICRTGKEIVLTAFTSVQNNRQSLIKKTYLLRRNIRILIATLSKYNAELPRLNQAIAQTTHTLFSVTTVKQSEKEQLLVDIGNAENLKREQTAEFTNKTNDLKKLSKGCGVWIGNAGILARLSWKEAVERINAEIESEKEALYRLNFEIETLQTQITILSSSASSSKSEALAQAFDTPSLAHVLDHVSDSEARALEIMMHGLTDGVIGIEPDQLSSIYPSTDLPDLFWIGKNSPSAGNVHVIGDWYVMPSLGGYSVMSKDRALVFGKQSRLDRISKHEEEIKRLSELRITQNTTISTLETRRDQLHEHKEIIQYYFDHKEKQIEWELEQDKAKEAVIKYEQEIGQYRVRRDEIEREITTLAEKYQIQIDSLNKQKSILERSIAVADAELVQEKERYAPLRPQCKAISSKYRTCRSLVFHHLYLKNGLSDFADYSLNDNEYLVSQTKNMDRLGISLGADKTTDISFLAEIEVSDPEHCVSIWPALMHLMRERMPAELLDRDFDDLINEMEQRRVTLRERVTLHEGQVKIQARNIASSITQEINSHTRRIKNLSSLGDSIRFGNATGVRIDVSRKREMMSLLEAMAEQSSLFSTDDRPIEVIIREFFEASLATKLEGVDLLDYRAYVDLRIEVRRRGSDWKPATSLSGGESIGCGLAFALMLFRSLVARSEYKASEMMPVFVLDELNRIDPAGQQLIAEFCGREGIQLVITAPAMEPTHEFKLYTLARNYDGREQLIVRELRGFHH